jgi:DNA-binding transcriptional ArsR family regulator
VVSAADQLDATFAALANPVRRDLVGRLGAGELSVTALAEPLAISLQGVSQHLDVLEAAGIVVREKRGRTRYCRLLDGPLEEASGWLEAHRQTWRESLEAFRSYVESDHEGRE